MQNRVTRIEGSTVITWLVFVAMFMGLVLAYAGAVYGEGIDPWCAREWPGDYAMQQHCVERQEAALEEIDEWMVKNIPRFRGLGSADSTKVLVSQAKKGHLATTISARCLIEWVSEGDADYAMAMHCIKRQEEAVKRLGKSLQDVKPEQGLR